MIYITDYDHGCGGLAHGFSNTGKFLIETNLALNRDNMLCYTFNQLLDLYIGKEEKLSSFFMCSPDLGSSKNRKKSGFKVDDLNFCLNHISEKKYPYVLICIHSDFIPFLHTSKKVVKTIDDYPTNDVIIVKLVELGYKVEFFNIDEADFGIPQHKNFAFYFASLNDFTSIYEDLLKKKRSKPHSVGDFLKNITDDMHINWHNIDYSKRELCAEIKQGSSASKTKSITQSSGYYRLEWDKTVKNLGTTFYKVSSRFPSIHPIYDRPLTIREGAYLSGLLHNYMWDIKMSKNKVATMIYNSFSPLVSMKIAEVVFEKIGV